MTDLGRDVTSTAPAAGWYPDPADPGASRWWSGVAWTDHVQAAGVAAVPAQPMLPAAAPVVSVAPVMAPAAPIYPAAPAFPAVSAPPLPTSPAAVAAAPALASSSNLDADGVPLNLFADSIVAPSVFTPPTAPASQSDWHNQTGRGVVPRRQVAGSVSLSTGAPAGARNHNPYQRNWIAGVALAVALLSILALGAKVLFDLPPLSQSILGGAPIAISLLALTMSVRRGNGIVLSIIALLISAGVLLAGLFVDPELLRSIVDSVTGLLPS